MEKAYLVGEVESSLVNPLELGVILIEQLRFGLISKGPYQGRTGSTGELTG